MTFRFLLLFCLLVGLPAATAAEDAEPQRLIIGLDLSVSNPLVEDPKFALKLAERVAGEIRSLPLRSRVMVRTFGDNDATANTLQVEEVVSARNRPEKIALDVGKLITQVPSLVADGQLQSQQNTNILAFLQTMVKAIGECRTPTRFILLSDGIEDSEFARLRDPAARLPALDMRPPGDRRYKCNELQILGLGQGLAKYQDIEHLGKRWHDWAATGADRPFKDFSGLNDW